MPIYEYQCQKCDGVFEAMQSISAPPLKKCQLNGCTGKVQRLVSASGFILKGTGWYATDYPSESRKQGWESESKKDQAASGGGASADSSPQATKPPAPEKTPGKSNGKKKTTASKNPYSGKGGKKVKTSK